jgi:predicted transcriptional regulator
MEVLWKKGPSTVGEVADALPKRKSVAYNTVLTILRILERKGYVRHTKEGRAFIYHPVIGKREACRNAVSYVVSRFFQNSPELLVLNMLEDGKIDESEMKRLKKLLEENDQEVV